MPSSIPGGSSSGSAVAVAAGLVDFAIGEFSLLACQVIVHLKMPFSQRVYVFSLISLPIQCNKQSLILFCLGHWDCSCVQMYSWKVESVRLCVLFGLIQL